MEKQHNSGHLNTQSGNAEFVISFKNEISKKSKDGLNTVVKKLNYLCLEFDPYNCLELRTEEENIINEFNLNEFLNNPFLFTNVVLQLMDIVENELKNRFH